MEYVDGVDLQELVAQPRPARPGPRRPLRPPGGRRVAARPLGPACPPRHQAGQPASRPKRSRQGPGPRAGSFLPRGRGLASRSSTPASHPRHGRLRGAGTGPRQPRRGHSGRHLQPGGDVLFPPRRPAAVRRRHAQPETPLAPDEGADAGAEPAAGSARGDGGGRGADDGEGAAGATRRRPRWWPRWPRGRDRRRPRPPRRRCRRCGRPSAPAGRGETAWARPGPRSWSGRRWP